MSVNIKNCRQIVKRDMEALYLGNLKTVEFDLKLPEKGIYGSDIRWESDQERFIDREGRVTRPVYGMGNREVTLTGIFSCEDICEKKDYHVTVLEQENPYKEKLTHRITVPEWQRKNIRGTVSECTEATVRILPGNEFYDTQERMHRYLLSVEDDRMLYHFRKASGLDTKGAESLDGWDSEECKLKGHTTGHYLSALALCYHSTGDQRIRDKADYMVSELLKCQQAFSHIKGIHEGFLSGYSEEQFDLLERYTPYPQIWAPYYTLHKIIAGLLDCYQYIGSEEALEIAEKVGIWTFRRLSRLPQRQLTKMWGMYIAGEFGGMNVVMAQLSGLTEREEFVQCARLFDNDKLFEPLSKQIDMLSGMHANQHIPQILGAIEMYKVTGEKRYLDIAKAFWTTVTKNRTYATGGVGETEMFRGFREIGRLLTSNTQETCASYNMLKLTKELYQIEPDARYMDYYERTLLNHILATPAKDDSGESTYFFPLKPGARREFLRENSCCHGTGMESHFRYREGIYYHDGKDIYINLYIPSELTYDEQNTYIQMERISRREQRYRIRIQAKDAGGIYLRRPDWSKEMIICEGQNTLSLVVDQRGYICVPGSFDEERQIEVQCVPGFRMIRTPDEPSKAAVAFGPYILAAISDYEDFIQVSFDESNVTKKMRWEDTGDDIHLLCDDLRWIPIYEIDDLSYHIYMISPFKE